jgi:hypothetical protein
MSIRSSLQGKLPAIECEPADLVPEAAYSLTEVACRYLYGVPFTPGTNGTLRQQRQASIDASMARWHDPNSPGWLIKNLELMLVGKEWKDVADCSPDSMTINNGYFVGAQRWLSQSGLTVKDALAKVKCAHEEIVRREADVAGRSERFYEVLTQLTANEGIRVRGVPYRDNQLISCDRSRTLDEPVPTEYFLDNVLHHLDENSLDIQRFSTEEEMLDRIFNRHFQAEDAMLVEYRSVMISTADAEILLRSLGLPIESYGNLSGAGALYENDVTVCRAEFLGWVNKGPVRKRVHKAVEKFWPDGNFGPMEVGERNDRIANHMKNDGSKRTSDPTKTIQRYIAERRKHHPKWGVIGPT